MDTHSSTPKSAKKAKKDKKEKKSKSPSSSSSSSAAAAASSAAADDSPVAAAEGTTFISPIAKPLAGVKLHKKLFKAVRKATDAKMLKRGVKEVVKALRKGSKGLCVLAGDISPMDVISHIPVFCESNGVGFVFVTAKAELGEAAKTKRPTSCVLLTVEGVGKDRLEELCAEVAALDHGIA